MTQEDAGFAFAFALLLFACYLCIYENRRQEARKDRREDLRYERMLNERREFGFKNVENSVNNRPIIHHFLKK